MVYISGGKLEYLIVYCNNMDVNISIVHIWTKEKPLPYTKDCNQIAI